MSDSSTAVQRVSLPFEFTIAGPPVSHQAKNRSNLQAWKNDVRSAAQQSMPATLQPVVGRIRITITYYYEGDTPDVDNIIKPIQDALNGLVFAGDCQVYENLKITNGMLAVAQWRRACDADLDPVEREQYRRDLEAYCGRDTVLMHEIIERLRSLSGWQPSSSHD